MMNIKEYADDMLRSKYRNRFTGLDSPDILPYYISVMLETTDYLPPNVLGMTDTKTKIWILPRERMPYGMWNHVLRHEVEHCLDPLAGEDIIDRRAADYSREPMRRRVRISHA